MPAPYTGGCLCGDVRYVVKAEPLTFYICHCTDCQRRTGTAFAQSMVVSRSSFELQKGKPAHYAVKLARCAHLDPECATLDPVSEGRAAARDATCAGGTCQALAAAWLAHGPEHDQLGRQFSVRIEGGAVPLPQILRGCAV